MEATPSEIKTAMTVNITVTRVDPEEVKRVKVATEEVKPDEKVAPQDENDWKSIAMQEIDDDAPRVVEWVAKYFPQRMADLQRAKDAVATAESTMADWVASNSGKALRKHEMPAAAEFYKVERIISARYSLYSHLKIVAVTDPTMKLFDKSRMTVVHPTEAECPLPSTDYSRQRQLFLDGLGELVKAHTKDVDSKMTAALNEERNRTQKAMLEEEKNYTPEDFKRFATTRELEDKIENANRDLRDHMSLLKATQAAAKFYIKTGLELIRFDVQAGTVKVLINA